MNEANYNKNNGSGNSSRRDSGSDRDSGSSRSSGSSVNNSARNSRSSRRPGTGGRDESTIKLSFATYSLGQTHVATYYQSFPLDEMND